MFVEMFNQNQVTLRIQLFFPSVLKVHKRFEFNVKLLLLLKVEIQMK